MLTAYTYAILMPAFTYCVCVYYPGSCYDSLFRIGPAQF